MDSLLHIDSDNLYSIDLRGAELKVIYYALCGLGYGADESLVAEYLMDTIEEGNFNEKSFSEHFKDTVKSLSKDGEAFGV